MRTVWIINLLFWSASLYGQGKIRNVYIPREVVSGDSFVVAVVASGPKAGVERMTALSVPSQLRFSRAFLTYGALEEPEPLESYQSGASLFQQDKNRKVLAVRQSPRPFPVAGSVVYYFVFVAPELNADMAIRAALAERGTEVVTSEPVEKTRKPKKGSTKPKPQASSDPLEWHIVSPQTSEFRFSTSAFKEFEGTMRCVSGWDNNSRGLSLGKAELSLDPAYTLGFFNGQFTIEWWQQGIAPSAKVLTIGDADRKPLIEIATNVFGQLYVGRAESEASLISNDIITDGAWHHFVWSRDRDGLERLFVDAVLEDTITHQFMPDGIATVVLGGETSDAITIDELHFIRRPREQAEEFAPTVAIAVRDTLRDALAIFHFEEIANVVRSTIPLSVYNEASKKTTLVPITIQLGPKAKTVSTSSPVMLDHAVLSLDQSSSSKVGFAWKATSEYKTVRYELQRRIASFGSFEKVISVPVRHPIVKGEELVARSAYSASEKLPSLKRDIDIYYRLAVYGAGDTLIDVTSPLKFELGGPKDIFLEQNKPNPFNPKTTIAFTLKKNATLKISVFDIIGREVLVVANKQFPAGTHSFEIDATNWPGGIYFYKLKSGNTILTRRMTLAK